MLLEEVSFVFKNDPLFDYYWNHCTRGQFVKMLEMKRERLKKNPPTGLENLL